MHCHPFHRIAHDRAVRAAFRPLAAIALGLSLLVLCQLGIAAAHARSAPTGKIAFVRGGDIYVMSADGSRTQRLTTTAKDESHPSWSPDGRRIAFIRAGATRGFNVCLNEIWVMNADGTAQRRAPFSLGPKSMPGTTHAQTAYAVADIAWSPDGRSIAVGASAYSSYPDMAGGLFAIQLYLMRPDGTQRRRFGALKYSMGLQGLGWRPDGSGLVLNRWVRGYGELLFCDAATGTTTKPYPDRAMWNAAWSPDGKHLAVCLVDAGYESSTGRAGMPAFPRHLAVIDRPSGEQHDLWAGTWDGTYELHPTWSPDGAWLACSYEPEGASRVDTLLLAADGSSHRLLKSDASQPAWRP